MKFITDCMLGKLTRWLRILGNNTKYSSKLEDSQLIVITKKDRRKLLTRDLELYQQAIAQGVNAFYVDGNTAAEKLAQIAHKFKIQLDVEMKKSRCPRCNERIKSITKDHAVGKVEKSTVLFHNEFWECPKCSQIYWKGAHWRNITKTLEAAKRDLKVLNAD